MSQGRAAQSESRTAHRSGPAAGTGRDEHCSDEPGPALPVVDLDAIERGYGHTHYCGVCLGVSPARDGHDVNPPCRGYVWESIPALIAEVRHLRTAGQGAS